MIFSHGKLRLSVIEVASAAGTTILTVDSAQYQILTGVTTQAFRLPNATTMAGGLGFSFINASTGLLTVYYNDGVTVLATLASGASMEVMVTGIGTTNGTWRIGTFAGGTGGGAGSVAPGATLTSNYTVLSADRGRVLNVNTASGTVDIQLPTPALGFVLTIKDVGGAVEVFPIRILRAASEKIDSIAANQNIAVAHSSMTLISDGTDWFIVGSFAKTQASDTSQLAVFGGGYNFAGTATSAMEYVNMAIQSDAASIGSLTQARGALGACASSVRGCFAGGGTATAGAQVNTIDFFQFGTLTGTIDFGDLTVARDYTSGAGSSTRGIFAGGYNSAAYPNTIDYITIASLGNATNFGNLTVGNQAANSGLASPTRAVWATSGTGGTKVEYVTIASTGNATNFGNLSVDRGNLGGSASATRGLFSGGNDGSYRNIIDYITIASTGNALDFGDLTVSRTGVASCSSSIRSMTVGGQNASVSFNTLDFVVIASLGNSVDFGDLTTTKNNVAACSNCHGGL